MITVARLANPLPYDRGVVVARVRIPGSIMVHANVKTPQASRQMFFLFPCYALPTIAAHAISLGNIGGKNFG